MKDTFDYDNEIAPLIFRGEDDFTTRAAKACKALRKAYLKYGYNEERIDVYAERYGISSRYLRAISPTERQVINEREDLLYYRELSYEERQQ